MSICNSMVDRLEKLENLKQKLLDLPSSREKLQYLNLQQEIIDFFKSYPELLAAIEEFDATTQVGLKSIVGIGQGAIVYGSPESFALEKLKALAATVAAMETVYDSAGGVVGYYLEMLHLIREHQVTDSVADITYLHPEGTSISNPEEAHRLVRAGIEQMPRLADMYPIGGAGDRLNLKHEETGEPLPASKLSFCGKTLLAGLMRDLQAREYLYFKLNDIQLTTPVAMMTSDEKNNHAHVKEMFENAAYFGRPQNSFMFFTQPLVPVITIEGDWAMQEPLNPILKPGGHGVMWKLAADAGVFEWLLEKATKVLVRQINNPICGVDNGLLAFSGLGLSQNKDFGFASCPRIVNAPEGMDVCVQKKTTRGFECSITNVEYTDFAQKGLEDLPSEPNGIFSKFPANTNILFADLLAVLKAIKVCPIPGKLINMKSKVVVDKGTPQEREVLAGRLESTMQNIADYITDTFQEPLLPEDQAKLRTYITFNERRKTLSVTKQLFKEGQPFLGTPEGSFYEKLQNDYELLTTFCKVQTPPVPSEEEFLRNGPSFILHYHPALGPLFGVIGQKLCGGQLLLGAELELEIAEFQAENLVVEGCLIVKAENPLGKTREGVLRFGNNGRCMLKNVTVRNSGIDHTPSSTYWNGEYQRKESVTIAIQGNGEFIAENITFKGNYSIEVPDGYLVRARMEGEKVVFDREKIESPTWEWIYAFDANDKIILTPA